MKIYKENKLKVEDFLIVSFFTQNYKDKADRLINSLNNFNLNYKIFEVPTIHYSKSDKGSNDINYCMPKLIIDMLKQFKVPIIFLDCDLVVMKEPKLFYSLKEKNIDFAIYNWLEDSENDGYLPVKLKINSERGEIEETYYINSVNVKLLNNPNKEGQLFSSGGVAYFSESNSSINVLNEWLENIIKYPKAPDDQLLDHTFNYSSNVRKNLKVEWLDKSYCRVFWWIFSEPIINHPGHMSHRVNDNFFKITGKERFKIENTIKRNSSKVSKEFIIDAKNKKILKVEKGKIFVVRSFTESVYV
ncbi:putative nucleotide-diphospho-sugar transferase [Candidatus Pelagibacter sp.]|nr:putative nucleotide-diphospho-sugar transferase [Candidatus Pelagibacter sp.]